MRLPHLVAIGSLLATGCLGQAQTAFDFDQDGSPDAEDCGPSDPNIRPGLPDPIGDGIDQNCDGADGVDADGDGWGSGVDHDCNDNDANIHPGADDTEGDGIDQNCDEIDGDNTGDDDDSANPANQDEDKDGFTPADGDCDDYDDNIHPDADDTCDDETDTDCDGEVGEDEWQDFWPDADGDGAGDETAEPVSDCEAPKVGDYVTNDGDCDDDAEWANAYQEEVCDGEDNDCNGVADFTVEDTDDDTGLYNELDEDVDGWVACWGFEHWDQEQYFEGGDDCNDKSSDIHPGAEDICDPWDNDCDCSEDSNGDGTWCGAGDAEVNEDADSDGDGFTPCGNDGIIQANDADPSQDCDDDNPYVFPGAPTDTCNLIDDDCDTAVDEDGVVTNETELDAAAGSGTATEAILEGTTLWDLQECGASEDSGSQTIGVMVPATGCWEIQVTASSFDPVFAVITDPSQDCSEIMDALSSPVLPLATCGEASAGVEVQTSSTSEVLLAVVVGSPGAFSPPQMPYTVAVQACP